MLMGRDFNMYSDRWLKKKKNMYQSFLIGNKGTECKQPLASLIKAAIHKRNPQNGSSRRYGIMNESILIVSDK